MPLWKKLVDRRKTVDVGAQTAKQATQPVASSAPPTSSDGSITHTDPDKIILKPKSVAAKTLTGRSLQSQPEQVPEVRKKRLFPGKSTLGLQELHKPIDGKQAAVDIVFVHGLSGDAFDTWYQKKIERHANLADGPDGLAEVNRKDGIYWPVDLLPQTVEDPVRIMSFGYDADVTRVFGAVGQGKLRDHADTLLSDLARHRELDDTQDRKIIFVAHSLGGLIVKKMLCLSESSIDPFHKKIDLNVIGIAFLGVPHRGSSFAPYAHGMAYILKTLRKRTNTNIVDVLNPGSEILTDIERSFGIWLRKNDQRVHIAPFYEDLELPVVGKVVDQESAQVSGFIPIPIHANHMNMVRFSSAADSDYQRIAGEIKIWLKRLRQQELLAKTEITKAHEEFLRSLHYESIGRRFQDTDEATPDTFEWVWKLAPFSEWLMQSNKLFWISGKPGSGKSTMLRYLSENFGTFHSRPSIVVTHFFDFRGDDMSRSAEGLLRSLLWQILKSEPEALKGSMPIFEDMKNTRSSLEWRRKDLEIAWTQTLGRLSSPLFIFVDALDEFDGEVTVIAELLLKLCGRAKHGTSICAASRPQAELQYTFRHCGYLVMEENTADDIKLYSRAVCAQVLEESPTSVVRSSEIIDGLYKHAQGVFLWVKLAGQDVVRGVMRGEELPRLRERVDKLPLELEALYVRLLEGMEKIDRIELIKMLAIVVCARRPLKVEEFGFALDFQSFALDLEHITSIRQRLNAIGIGFLEERNGAIHLAHKTVLNFANVLPETKFDAPLSGSIRQGHLYLLEACLHRLLTLNGLEKHTQRALNSRNSSRFDLLDKNTASAISRNQAVFSRYAVLHWKAHQDLAHEANHHSDSPMRRSALTAKQHLQWLQWFLAICWEEEQLWSRGFDNAVVVQSALLELLMLQATNEFPTRSGYAADWDTTDHQLDVTSSILSFSRDIGLAIVQMECSFIGLNRYLENAMQMEHKLVAGLEVATEILFPIIRLIVQHTNLSSTIPGIAIRIAPDAHMPRPNGSGAFLFVPVNKDECDELEHLSMSVLLTNDIQKSVAVHDETKRSDEGLHTELDLASIARYVSRYGLPAGKRIYSKQASPNTPGTPLQYAAYHTLTNLVDILLCNGADPNLQADHSLYGTPLIAAVYSLERASKKGGEAIESGFGPQVAVIALLLGAGGNPNIAGSGTLSGLRTPLEAACRIYKTQSDHVGVGSKSILRVIKMLFLHGAVADAVTNAIVETIRDKEIRTVFSTMKPHTIPDTQADLNEVRELLRGWAADQAKARLQVRKKRLFMEPIHDGGSLLPNESGATQKRVRHGSLQEPRRTFSVYDPDRRQMGNSTYDGVIRILDQRIEEE